MHSLLVSSRHFVGPHEHEHQAQQLVPQRLAEVGFGEEAAEEIGSLGLVHDQVHLVLNIPAFEIVQEEIDDFQQEF